VLPFPAPEAAGHPADAWEGDSTADIRVDDVGFPLADTRDTSELGAQTDTSTSDSATGSADAGPPDCPPEIQTSVVECVFTAATEGEFLGDWDRALLACTTPQALGALLDATCTPGAPDPVCQHPRTERPEQWLLVCRHHVDDAVRDDLCLFGDTWSSTLLSGRVILLEREVWTEPSQVPSAYLELVDRLLDPRSETGLVWEQRWTSLSIQSVELEQLVDLTRLANLWMLAVTTPSGRRASVYAEAGVDPVALLQDDQVSGCTLGEGNGLRPCRADFECRPQHFCRVAPDQALGRCIDLRQATPTPSEGQACTGHRSCAPPLAICMVTDPDPVCISTTSRGVSSRWSSVLGSDTDGAPVTVSELRVFGARTLAQAVAIRLHLRTPLSLADTVTLRAPDGTEIPVPWARDWSEWVPLPHAAGHAANGDWRLTIRREAAGGTNGFDGWSLRVDAL
jgi:hypothetical protein